MLFERCPQFDTICRFASIETTYAPFTAIKLQDCHYIPIRQGYKKNVLGVRCNNSGDKMVDELRCCPARLALVKWCGVRASGTGHYPKLIGSVELRELMREKVPGQQVLQV